MFTSGLISSNLGYNEDDALKIVPKQVQRVQLSFTNKNDRPMLLTYIAPMVISISMSDITSRKKDEEETTQT